MRKRDVEHAQALRPATSSQGLSHASDDSERFQRFVSSDRRRPVWDGHAWIDGFVQTSRIEDAHTGSVSGRWQRASRSGSTDGSDFGSIGSGESAAGFRFDRIVPSNGYAWWYVDALSDDGLHGITVIAFIGSVFSPHYARQRRRSPADPTEHCALNIALYSPRSKQWAMTERGSHALHQTPSTLSIGPNHLEWDGDALTIYVEETGSPIPSRVRGTIRLMPHALFPHSIDLDSKKRHRWTPIAPSACVEVDFDKPDCRWSGDGYFDSNRGDEPLEASIKKWTWSRANVKGGTAVIFDVVERNGEQTPIAMQFSRTGGAREFTAPSKVRLPSTGWRIERCTRSDNGIARCERTLEDTPFYSRSIVSTRWLDQSVTGMHESLNLDRFRSPIVQAMLRLRMRRTRR